MYTSQQRIDILKRYETHCYQVCFFILGNEQDAIIAAQNTLKKLYTDNVFMESDNPKGYIKKEATKFSLKYITEIKFAYN